MKSYEEIQFESLALAREFGPPTVARICRERGARLLSELSYVEREGLGFVGYEIDEPEVRTTIQPAPVGSEDHNADPTEND